MRFYPYGTHAANLFDCLPAGVSRRFCRLCRGRRRDHHHSRLSDGGHPGTSCRRPNKLVNGSGTLVATLKYIKSGKVVWRPALLAGVGALLGSAVGTQLAAVISEAALQALLLIALPCVAVFLTIRKDFGKETPEEQKVTVSSAREALTACLIGLVFGCYDGLLGPGTGTFMIMGFTAFLSMDLITASGCSKVSNLASNIASAAVWVLHGQVLWMLALPAVCCSIIGNYLGAQYAIRGGSKKIRNMMFVVLALLFIKMAYELLF